MHLSRYAPIGGLSCAFSNMSVEEPPDSPTADNKSDGEGGDEGDRTKESNVDEQGTAEKEASQIEKQPSNVIQKETTTKISYPECWFEDEESGTPLRWHLFVGVLYDLMKGKASISSDSSSFHTRHQTNECLPWRIRVHFTSYPTNQLLPLDCSDYTAQTKIVDEGNDKYSNENDIHRGTITTLIGRIFRNSLKQALFLQYGSSRVAMSITKNSHEKIWEAVLHSDYARYHEVNVELQSGIEQPSIGSETRAITPAATNSDNDSKGDDHNIPQLIPVRLMLNDMPAIQKPIRHDKGDREKEKKRPTEVLQELGTYQVPPYTTLGDVLANWLPNHYEPFTTHKSVVPVSNDDDEPSSLYFCIHGIQPSMECAMVDLWRALSHPDHFLYIIVVTKKQ